MTKEKDRRYRALYDQYKADVFEYLLRLSGNNKETAEDLSQEVWIACFRNFDSLLSKEEEELQSWLYLMCRKKFLEELAGRYPEKEWIFDMLPDDPAARQAEEEMLTCLLLDGESETFSEEERLFLLCEIGKIPADWVFDRDTKADETAPADHAAALERLEKILREKYTDNHENGGRRR